MKRKLQFRNKTFGGKRFTLAGVVSVLLLVTMNFSHAQARLPDPCPDLGKVLTSGNALIDLEGDVDRLSLCVQRAKLLSELDRLYREREGILSKNQTSDFAVNGIVPVSVRDLPMLPDVPQVQSKVLETVPLTSGFNEWMVVRLWGQSGNLKAQLRSETGVMVSVAQGDVLADDSQVFEVSPMGVTLLQDKETIGLKWAERDN